MKLEVLFEHLSQETVNSLYCGEEKTIYRSYLESANTFKEFGKMVVANASLKNTDAYPHISKAIDGHNGRILEMLGEKVTPFNGGDRGLLLKSNCFSVFIPTEANEPSDYLAVLGSCCNFNPAMMNNTGIFIEGEFEVSYTRGIYEETEKYDGDFFVYRYENIIVLSDVY